MRNSSQVTIPGTDAAVAAVAPVRGRTPCEEFLMKADNLLNLLWTSGVTVTGLWTTPKTTVFGALTSHFCCTDGC